MPQPFLTHEHPWTRLAALRLNLASGVPSLLPDEVAELLLRSDLSFLANDLNTGLFEFRLMDGASATSTWNDLVCDAAQYLFRVRPGRETAEVLCGMYHRHISAHTAMKLDALTVAMGFPELAVEAEEERRFLERLRSDPVQPADDFLLDMLGEALGGLPSPPERRKLLTLGQFLHDIRMGRFVAGAYQVLGKRHDPPAVKAVLMGLIGLLRVDPAELAADVAWARTQRRANGFFLFTLPHGRESTEDWGRARTLSLSVADLVRALRHPSRIIATLAAYLIAGGVGGDQAREMVKEVLRGGHPQALSVIASIAQFIWEDDARRVLLDRLDAGMTAGCEDLIEQLPKLPGEVDHRLLEGMAAAVRSESVPIVTAAAEALFSLSTDMVAPLIPLIREAYSKWTESGAPCPRCGTAVKGSRCPRCHPDESGAYTVNSSPRAALISLLVHLNQLGVTELVFLCGDSRSDVSETARKALTSHLTKMPETIPDILGTLRTDDPISTGALRAILAVEPHLLAPYKEQLLDLLSAPASRVRHLLVRHLASAQWLSLSEARAAAITALNDTEPSIRDRAVLTIRTIEQRGI